MKIYTKTGDSGQTRLVSGTQVSKSSARLDSYGGLDELNSILGLCRADLDILESPGASSLSQELEKIQHQLFNLGSLLACDRVDVWSKLPQISQQHIDILESRIDEMSAQLPELRQFILPGGSRAASSLHLARTVCRRVERETVRLAEQEEVPELSIIYLNRLSDYLFTAARFANKIQGRPDVVWSSAQA